LSTIKIPRTINEPNQPDSVVMVHQSLNDYLVRDNHPRKNLTGTGA
jgi:hypothetical protein